MYFVTWQRLNKVTITGEPLCSVLSRRMEPIFLGGSFD